MLRVRLRSLACVATIAALVPHALVASAVAGDTPRPAVAALNPVAGDVTGTVKDSTGTPLPGVQVIVTGADRTTTTGSEGRFSLRGLPAGEYHITTLLIGFKPGHAVVAVPATGSAAPVDIVMTSSPLRLESVNVTATATGADPERVPQATTEVSGLALQRTLKSNIAQTLEEEPGISVRFNGPATMPVIRGLTGDRILVLQDGERTGDLSSAAPDHENTVDPLAASRVEVVRGPASLLYGNNALGGVVNVISNDIPTAVPTHLEGYFGAIGESGTPGASSTLSLTTGLGDDWALSVRGGMHSASRLKVGGGEELDNTQSRNWTGTAGLGYIGSSGTAGFSFTNYNFNYGLPHAADDPELSHIVGNRMNGTFRASWNPGADAVSLVKLDAAAQDYHHDEVGDDGAIHTSFKLRTQTVNGSAKTKVGRWTGSIGAQLLMKQYAAEGEEALTPAANSNGVGAFFYEEVPLADATGEVVPTFSVGGRFDTYRITSKDSDDPKFGAGRTVNVSSPSGSVGLSLPVGSYVTISGSAAMAFRAPTVEELFSNAIHDAAGEYEIGNPTLRAEQSQGFEGIVRVATGKLTASASAYVNNISNYVYPNVTADTTIDGETMPLAIYEQKDARLSGLEGSLEYRATNAIVLGAMGDYVKGSFTGGGALPFMPPGRVGGSIRWDDGTWNLGVDAKHGFEQARVTGGSDIATDAFTVLNVSAGVNTIISGRVHTLTLRVDNVGDTRYYDAASRIKEFAPNPGRNVALVYKVLF
ncbi:MAG TPA: TonB-dependent receptor [Gemmatimonadaceae bacterium]|nr:TonB-dependent receptor [Gemmatimonadaceae bacterium]